MTSPSLHSPKPPKSFLKQISIILSSIAIITGGLFYTTTVLSQEATSPAVPDEEIKENIKDRLQKAIKDKDVEILLKRAWVGTLETIANHTLTIETRDGPKLASISAESTFILLPKRVQITAEELEIGSYTIAMGFLSENQVLNTQRVIIQKETPQNPKRQAYFATSLEYNPNEDLVTVSLASGETQNYNLNDETEITKRVDSAIEEAQIEQLEGTKHAIIIIKTEEDEEEITTTTLLRIHILPILGENKIDMESEATQAAEEKLTEATEAANPDSQ